MRIYTKFGDKGNTTLFTKTTVPKNHPRVEAYGSVDELNALIGVVISTEPPQPIRGSLEKIQKDLFSIGAELAGAKSKKLLSLRISEIEGEIDKLSLDLPPLHNFILPSGHKTAALLHLARTVCRRSERQIITLSQKEPINLDIVVYMNRVGDLFFVQARYVNHKKRIQENIWKG
ncbi:MAG: cob(I)yrinic acid a,c-diamide adenosyltransferase [Candidatus Micrarchaeota archaeon]